MSNSTLEQLESSLTVGSLRILYRVYDCVYYIVSRNAYEQVDGKSTEIFLCQYLI